MRLSKYIAQAGIASRRQAEELILKGEVKVNGQVVTELGSKVNPESDCIEYNGELISVEKKIYILLYKPSGYISSVVDPYGRPTVVELLKDINQRIYPVGRLDFDTEGLLLLSNDGYFTNLMIHPRYKIRKRYQALVKGIVKEKELSCLRNGIMLEDGMTAPAQACIIKIERYNTLLEICINEGRKRQIKRMCSSIGYPVIKLKRVGFAFLNLNGVKPGKYRNLTEKEINGLINIAQGN